MEKFCYHSGRKHNVKLGRVESVDESAFGLVANRCSIYVKQATLNTTYASISRIATATLAQVVQSGG